MEPVAPRTRSDRQEQELARLRGGELLEVEQFRDVHSAAGQEPHVDGKERPLVLGGEALDVLGVGADEHRARVRERLRGTDVDPGAEGRPAPLVVCAHTDV
ncbi:hypothetical protein GCM10022214_00450 [Actinomadura miaoliensis]|uniref:Uncharacterized protein n=1 Tax=Actinomadura miaoliensis TaxID=430685 RepID=A0ABP7UVA8_9ACTN